MFERAQTEAVLQPYQQAAAAWKGYQKTSLHTTLDELDAWLATWGTPDELPMPAPRVVDQSGTSLLEFRGTGQGLYGTNVGQAILKLRDEWL